MDETMGSEDVANKDREPGVTLWVEIGLPASGKTTDAISRVRNAKPGSVVRVNRDTLRAMLHDGVWAKGRTEKATIAARDALIAGMLQSGMSVVLDDTNLDPNLRKSLERLADRVGAAYVEVDHRHVEVEECIRRDAERMARGERGVGSEVIAEMWRTHLRDLPEPANAGPEAREAVIVDIDGTLARMQGRRPYDWHLVHTDTPRAGVVRVVRALHADGAEIVYVSGRDACCEEATREWIASNVGVNGPLFMRAAGDRRADHVVKRELYETHIAGRYRVELVLDDRDSVVRMWRDQLGLECHQVNWGRF